MSTGPENRRTIRTDLLARVEGEGAMYVEIDGAQVRDVKLRIYEPPRFFEAMLRGRAFGEAPDITSRICGICPIAYQMSSIRAMEDAFGMTIDEGPIRELRRLVYCGEWIESHSLHIYLLHAPDFLGQPSFLELARDQPRLAEQGLRMKKAGNALVTRVGGREVHPINLRVGGFYRAPRRRELDALRPALEQARETALQTVRWAAELPFPEFTAEPELLALRDPQRQYPIDRGRLVSSRGLDIAPPQFDQYIVEEHVEHSNALHARMRGRGSYLTGPMARYNLAFGCLGDTARAAARQAGLGSTCTNPFQSIIVRAVELVQACEDALSILSAYEPPDPPAVEVEPRAGIGHGATEAPRGVLYHRYELDEQGAIVNARIVPPTSQNQLVIEDQLRLLVEANLELSEEELRLCCEQAIRNHDPCISCATHFLDLTVARSGAPHGR